ncbi:hypothetical protein M3Y97_01077100 [Aphelenchoides bicaudatus]|nr:hypothetical protein M3Y97_01077100 [Aphelenchoides bicaudatus]
MKSCKQVDSPPPLKVSEYDEELEKLSLSEKELFDLLAANEAFEKCWKSGSRIEKLKVSRIGEGKGFLSQIHKIVIRFSNTRKFEFIVKIPKPYAFQEFLGNWQKDADNENVPVDQCVIVGHNSECSFYNQIKELSGCPLPKVYIAKKYESKNRPGLLLMENLAERAEVIGYHQGATIEQCFTVARSIAAMQYETSKTEKLKEWSKSQKTSYFEEYYDSQLPDSMAAIRALPGITPFLSKMEPILSRKFGFYSVFEKAKEFGALSFCYGDIQPNNLMFQKQKDGTLGSKLEALIDWQILFYGSASFDLARFMVTSPGVENRRQIEMATYATYYSELQRLHHKDGREVPFSYEQGLHLYELALCQQIGFVLMFLGVYLAMNANKEGILGNAVDRLLDNVLYAVERAIEIFEKRGLYEKF